MQIVDLNTGLSGAVSGGTWETGAAIDGDCSNVPIPVNIADYPSFDTNTGLVTLQSTTPHGVYPFTYSYTGLCGSTCAVVPIVVVNKPIFTSVVPALPAICTGDSIVIPYSVSNYAPSDFTTSLAIHLIPSFTIQNSIGNDVSSEFSLSLDESTGVGTITYEGIDLPDGTYTVSISVVAVYKVNGSIVQTCASDSVTGTIDIECIDPCASAPIEIVANSISNGIASLQIKRVDNSSFSSFNVASIIWQDGHVAANPVFALYRTISDALANPGPYTVTVTDTNGCIETATITISAMTVTVNTNAACVMQSIVTGGEAPYTYAWSDISLGGATGIIGTADTYDTNLIAGWYNVFITDANGATASASRIYNPLAITGYVFHDLDRNGFRSNGALPLDAAWAAATDDLVEAWNILEGYLVEIRRVSDDAVITSATTDVAGRYQLPVCAEACYVRFTPPAAVVNAYTGIAPVYDPPGTLAVPSLGTLSSAGGRLYASDMGISTLESGDINLTNNTVAFGHEQYSDVFNRILKTDLEIDNSMHNGGFYATCAIKGFAFDDIDVSNEFSGNNVVYQNVKVELWIDGGVASSATTSTDVNGEYAFVNLPPAVYYLKLDLTALTGPSADTLIVSQSVKDQNGDITIDSRIDAGTNQSDLIYATSNSIRDNFNIGVRIV